MDVCGKTKKDRIRDEHIHEMVKVAPIKDMLREQFDHVQQKLLDAKR